MKFNKSVFTLVMLVLALLSMSTAAAAPALKFTFKDVKAPGATETDSYTINDKGVIAGDYVDSSAVQHGMILAGSKLTSFDNPNCQNTGGATGSIAAFGINASGTVAGWCLSTKTGLAIGWTYAKKKFTNIVYPKAPQTEVNGINDKGDLVGLYYDSAGVTHGFVYHAKKYISLDPSGVTSTVAWSINNAGEISVYGLTSAYVSFYTKNYGKTYKSVVDPNQGSSGIVIHAINNKGDIDGTYYTSSGGTSGFLLHGGKYYDVQDPNGPTLTRADGLNSKLSMVGRYTPSAGGNVGFEATTK